MEFADQGYSYLFKQIIMGEYLEEAFHGERAIA